MTTLTSPIFRAFIMLVLLLVAGVVYAQASPSAEDIKSWIEQPLVLLGFMIVAAFASAFKQMWVAQRSGGTTNASEYFFAHWPETIIAIGQAVAFFITLVMTDTLNFASALGAGYVANSTADVWTGDGRSASLSPPKS